MTREKLTGNVDEAKQAAGEIGYPVVMKVMSADIPHKTEAGVIKLGISSEEALVASYGELLEKAKRFKADVRIDGVLIQEMAPKGVEMIIGMKRDASFGPVVMVGLGGIFVEVFKDVAFRVPPISLAGCPGDDRGDQGSETPERLPGDGEDGLRGDRGGADERGGPFAGSRRSDPGARHQPA